MKFRNPKTGKIYDFENRDCVISGFCRGTFCKDCPIQRKRGEMGCRDYVLSHPNTAARLMGYEVIEDSPPQADQSAKADAGKIMPTLVPPALIEAVAAVRGYGCNKYGDPDNWRRVEPQRYRDALYRHWLAYLKNPEACDPESGLPHLWHLATNAAFLIEIERGTT